jgi:hypothetical protein
MTNSIHGENAMINLQEYVQIWLGVYLTSLCCGKGEVVHSLPMYYRAFKSLGHWKLKTFKGNDASQVILLTTREWFGVNIRQQRPGMQRGSL